MTDDNRDVSTDRQRLSALMAEAAKNETILHRAQERELKLLRSQSLEELFDNMVAGLQASFGLDAVTLVLADPDHEVRQLLLFRQPQMEAFPGVLFVDDLAEFGSLYPGRRRAHLGPFVGGDHAALFPGSAPPRSIALMPLECQSRLMGYLCLGSSDAQRFTRHHATDFLDHLATIAGFCLENAINRARLVWSGLTDVLTGWHNRRYLNSRLPEEVARAMRLGTSLSCVLFDLDFFKKVNDVHGHLAGDAVLREVARRAQKQIRACDLAARFGGEEFVVLMPDTALAEALVFAERLRSCVSESPVRIDDHKAITVTVSVGVACETAPEACDDLRTVGERLLGRSDDALYAAKTAGRDRVERSAAPEALSEGA